VACWLARALACGIEPSRPLAKHFRSHSRTRRFNSAWTSEFCNSTALSICGDAVKVDLPPPPVLRYASNLCCVASALTALPLRSGSFRTCRAITVRTTAARLHEDRDLPASGSRLPLPSPRRPSMSSTRGPAAPVRICPQPPHRTPSPCTTTPPPPAVEPAFAPALPRHTCTCPNRVRPWPAPTSQVRLHFSRGQHFVEHLGCVLDTAKLASPRDHHGVGVLTATAFPHLAQKPATATPPARAPACSSSCTTSRAALCQRLLVSTRQRPRALAPSHAASRAAAWSCQPLGAARTAPAPAPALRRAHAPLWRRAPASHQPSAPALLAPRLGRTGSAPPESPRLHSPAPRASAREPLARAAPPFARAPTCRRLPRRARSLGACRARVEPPTPASAACPGQECPRALLPEPAKETRERGRKTGKRSATSGRRKERDAREKRNRGEREKILPKDLCAISKKLQGPFCKA
jgi:hypothetical protein